MKKSFVVAGFIFLFHLCCYTQPGGVGQLTVLSEKGMNFFVVLNGQQVNNAPQTNIRIENLFEPIYNVQIIFENRMFQPIVKDAVAIADAAGEFRDVTYNIKRYRNNSIGFNFVSMLPVRRNFNPAPNIYVVNYNPVMDIPDNVGCENRRAMEERDYNNAFTSIKDQGFDETRLKVAKQIVSSNCMTSDQIGKLTGIFGFDESRLEFAKFAYDFCTDPKNYFKVNSAFGFSASVEALSDYILSRK